MSIISSEYNVNSLRRGFGQLRDIRFEKMEPGKPSLVIHSSTFSKNEDEIVNSTNQVLEKLMQIELRKRFSIVHTEKYIYVIGGMLTIHQIINNVVFIIRNNFICL